MTARFLRLFGRVGCLLAMLASLGQNAQGQGPTAPGAPSSTASTGSVTPPAIDLCSTQANQANDLQQKLSAANANNADLRGQLDDASRRLVADERALGDASKRLADAQAELRDAQQKVTTLQAGMKQLQDDLGTAQAVRAQAVKDNAALTLSEAGLQKTVDALEIDNRSTQSKSTNAYIAWEQEKKYSSARLQALKDAKAQNTRMANDSQTREESLNKQIEAAKTQQVVAEKSSQDAQTKLGTTQGDLLKARELAEHVITGAVAACSVILFGLFLWAIIIVVLDTKRLSRASGAPDHGIAGDVCATLSAHFAAARQLRKLIVVASVLAALAALAAPALVLIAEVRSGADATAMTSVIDSIYWRMLLGFVAPLGALLAIYKTVHEKGTDALEVWSKLELPLVLEGPTPSSRSAWGAALLRLLGPSEEPKPKPDKPKPDKPKPDKPKPDKPKPDKPKPE